MNWPVGIGSKTIHALEQAAGLDSVPVENFGYGRRGSRVPTLLSTDLIEWVERPGAGAAVRVTKKAKQLLCPGTGIHRPAVLEWFGSLTDAQLAELWQWANGQFQCGRWKAAKRSA